MEISTAWVNYVNRMSKINAEATKKVGEYINSFGDFSYTNERHMRQLINYAYGISTKYGEGAAALACEMYDEIGLASGLFLDPAEPAEVAEYSEVAKAINGTAKTENPVIVSDSIGRLVKRVGADTTLKNGARDGAEYAWITNGDTCAYCIALASRGWQRASMELVRGHAEHIHANCDCTYAVRFNSNTTYKGYNPEKDYQMYADANTDSKGKVSLRVDKNGRLREFKQSESQSKINAMRRQNYAENREKIRAQQNLAYKERQERLAEELNKKD